MCSEHPRKAGSLGRNKLRRSFKERISRRIAGFCGGVKAFEIDKDNQEPFAPAPRPIKEEFVKSLVGKPNEQCTVEEFHYVVKAMYRYAIKATAEEQPQFKKDVKPTFDRLPLQLEAVLDQFSTEHQISKITRSLVECVVVMEVSSDKYCPCNISVDLVQDTISTLEMEWQSAQETLTIKSPVLSNFESAMFDHSATTYIMRLLADIKVDGGMTTLFPPQRVNVRELKIKMSLITILLNLNVWNNGDEARKEVNNMVVEQLQDDVKSWSSEYLTPLEVMIDLRSVVNQTNNMVTKVEQATQILEHQQTISQYFFNIGVDYFKVVSIEVEKMISSQAMSLVQEVDHYQVTYHRHHKHVLETSIATMNLYFALRCFFGVIKHHVGPRDLFKTLISSYQSWFEETVMFWLQTFRAECIKRMEKALEIEKDVVQVTSLVKHSNSSVDVISCFAKITSEWNNIDFHNADIALLGCTKITDTICDGATQYVERLYTILENNGYYDFIDNAQFDVTDQLCITLNNVMYVRKYLHELPSMLNFTKVCHGMAVKYEDDSIGEKSAKVLEKLVDSADHDMILRCRTMIKNIVERMAVDMVQLTKKFTQKAPEKKSSMDPLFVYLDANLQVLFEKLETMIFPFILEEIWYRVLSIFKANVLKGKQPTYYSYLIQHLYSIKGYVLREMDFDNIDGCAVYCDLLGYLKMQAMTTRDLVLMYYTELANYNQLDSSVNCGHLTVTVAYTKDTEDMVTICGKVLQANDLSEVKTDNGTDPVVSVMLHPHIYLFKTLVPKYTKVVEKSQNPVFNEQFSFENLNEDILKIDGTVITFTVWHHSTVIPNEIVGEVVVPLNCLEKITNVEESQHIIFPLTRPCQPKTGPFAILQQRQKNDTEAQKLIHTRSVMAGWQYPAWILSPIIRAITRMKGIVNSR